MSTPIEKEPWWGDVLAKLKSKKLRDIAREYKVPVAELQKALERTGQMPRPAEEGAAAEAAPAQAAPAAAPAAEAAAPKRRGRPPGKKTEAKAAAKPAAPKRGRAAAPAEKAAAPAEGRRGANARLEALRDQLGKIPDGEIAKRAGVARKTVVEFRKKHGIERYRGAEGGEKAEAAPAPAAPRGRKPAAPKAAAPEAKAPAAEAAASTGRASKLDAFLDIIGNVPDREVAEKSSMTTENVRMYRLRRGIPARWRGEGGGAPRPAAAAAAAPKAAGERPRRGRPPGPVGETRVDKALAPYKDQIGKVPDADIATRAGVSRSAVSAWRQKNKVGASGRPGRRKAAPAAAPAPAPKAQAAAPVAAAAPAPKAPQAKASASEGGSWYSGGFSWRVIATKGNETKTFGLLADDPVAAAQRATGGLKGWTIRTIELIGEALSG